MNQPKDIAPSKKQRLKEIISSPSFILTIWIVFLFFACLRVMGGHNNYIIFERSWDHLLSGACLYSYYPDEYHDHFLYGPAFTLLIAPFSALPKAAGMVLWLIASTGALYAGIRLVPDLTERGRVGFMWMVANEMYLALLMQQYNLLVAAFLLLSFVAVERDKPVLSAFLIALGFVTKIYGGIALLLFSFVRRKLRFTFSLIIFLVVLGLLPALFAKGGLEYVLTQYRVWLETLSEKDGMNLYAGLQNLGFLGMTRKTLGLPVSFSDLWIIAPAMLLQVLPLVRVKAYVSPLFRKLFFSSLGLFIVLFSTGTETNTYIIGYIGIAYWFLSTDSTHSLWERIIFIGSMALSFTTSDLMPMIIRNELLMPFALKAFFPTLVWGTIIYRLLTSPYPEKHPVYDRPKL